MVGAAVTAAGGVEGVGRRGGATGGGQIGSVRQRGGGAERVARSRGGAAAARAAWVGYGFHPFRGTAQHAAGADRAIAPACGGGRACG